MVRIISVVRIRIISMVKVVRISIGLWSWFSLSRSLAIVVVSPQMIGIVGPGRSIVAQTVVQPGVGLRLGLGLSESQSDNGKEHLKINVGEERGETPS